MIKNFACCVLIFVCEIRFSVSNTIQAINGHYPSSQCFIQNAVFISKDRTFYYTGDSAENEECLISRKIWQIQYKSEMDILLNKTGCEATFKKGLSFTIFYYGGGSNYYHLTYDMLIPIYKQWYFQSDTRRQIQYNDTMFMPTVETSRLKELDWFTPAFKDMSKYWVDMSKFIAEESTFQPLDETFLSSYSSICFDELILGTGKVRYGDPEIIQSYIQYVKKRFDIKEQNEVMPRLALISRKGRRLILNENEVIESLQNLIPSDLIEFSGMSFYEQVATVQKYTIFAAINGAGLMNAIYLPKNSVTIQMVPFNAGVNVKQYSILLKSRGPYLEWHNRRENMTVEMPGDKYNNRPNTIVDVSDFRKKVIEAMQLYSDTIRSSEETMKRSEKVEL